MLAVRLGVWCCGISIEYVGTIAVRLAVLVWLHWGWVPWYCGIGTLLL